MLVCLKTAVVLCRSFVFLIMCCYFKSDTVYISAILLPKCLSVKVTLKNHMYTPTNFKIFLLFFQLRLLLYLNFYFYLVGG